MPVAISYDPPFQQAATRLAETSKLPLYTAETPPPAFLLHLGATGLQLVSTQDVRLKPLYIDFTAGKNQHRRLYGGGKGQHLARAIGLNKYPDLRVIDTTAGLGRDAFVLASLGCQVTLLERNLPAYLLLKDALCRAKQSSDREIQRIMQFLSLHHGDSATYLSALSKAQYPEVIYMDPMFPPRDKSAKVKKEMAVFHALIGHDEDARQILQQALPRALKRIVVKRPRLADSLHPEPAFQIAGKSTRYDIYLPVSEPESS